MPDFMGLRPSFVDDAELSAEQREQAIDEAQLCGQLVTAASARLEDTDDDNQEAARKFLAANGVQF